MGETILRAAVVVAGAVLMGAVLAHGRGLHGMASALNAAIPLLFLGSSALALVTSPSPKLTPGGSVYLFPPVFVLLVSGARLFWLAWAINAAMVAFAVYLAFFFRIF